MWVSLRVGTMVPLNPDPEQGSDHINIYPAAGIEPTIAFQPNSLTTLPMRIVPLYVNNNPFLGYIISYGARCIGDAQLDLESASWTIN